MTARPRDRLLIALPLAAIVAALFADPVPQDPSYHDFADTRRLFGIDNCLNVVSNAAFLLVGAAGLKWLLRRGRVSLERGLYACYAAFLAGVSLTALGSAWYHLDPDTARLAFDRLPIALAFMGLTAAVLGEFVSQSAARRLLLPLLVAGAASVTWWMVTEERGAGDLRAYVLVQFVPLLLLPVILLLYAGDRSLKTALWAMLGLYGLAKIAELFDAAILDYGGIVSGHTLKHLLAAAASWLPVAALRRR